MGACGVAQLAVSSGQEREVRWSSCTSIRMVPMGVARSRQQGVECAASVTDLLCQVVGLAHLSDQAQLRFEPLDMLFLALEDRFQ